MCEVTTMKAGGSRARNAQLQLFEDNLASVGLGCRCGYIPTVWLLNVESTTLRIYYYSLPP